MKTFTKLVVAAACVVVFASCGGRAEIVHNRPLEEMAAQTQQAGAEHFFVVISRADCPPCTDYANSLNDKRNRRVFGKVLINMVDVSQPENAWYTHWLCCGAFPTTCIFAADGELEAVISGASGKAMECVLSSINGEGRCADDLYDRHYQVAGDHIAMLNELLACKRGLERGEDVGAALDGILQQTDYPYPTYLKALNENKQGRRDEAVRYAERVLGYDDIYYYYVYDDVFRQAKYIVNPDYTPQDDGMLTMQEEFLLNDCKIGEPRRVAIRVENTGKFPTFIRDITTSCTCVELLSPKQHRLDPGESLDIEVEFTGESKGEVYREVMFFSNSSEPLKRVALRAQVV
jgi:hypothetical protein